MRRTSAVITMPSRNCLPLTITMMTCLILIINISFKIIVVYGILFTANSVLYPLVAGLYLLALNNCNEAQQQQILNQSLLTLYLFSIGIYVLVNLPPASNMHDIITYQIIFENIPKKFFSSTLAFCLSFYLPHLYLSSKKAKILTLAKQRMILAFFCGFAFFSINFVLLFFNIQPENFIKLYTNSVAIVMGLLTSFGISYLGYLHFNKHNNNLYTVSSTYLSRPIYYYLIGFSVTILMICLTCEYRLITLGNGWTITVSGILFPLIILVNNIVGELYGYKANWHMTIILLISELMFELLLMITITLPSPDFFNLNPLYCDIMLQRIPAETLALALVLGSNTLFIEKLKYTICKRHQGLRIFIANIIANSLLCVVNYTILFSGIYPGEEIFNLALNSWTYKFITLLISLPLVLWIYNILHNNKQMNLHTTNCA